MSSERHRLIVDLFHRAVELPAERRAEFVAEACGADDGLRHQVEAMLEADGDAPSILEGNAEQWLAASDELPLPQPLGDYVLQRLLGRGGMAAVYLAEQRSPKREVAIKLMSAGLGLADSRERFALEAELLGHLQHPNVAQVFEAGIAELNGQAQPFYAMERIDGVDLVRHAREARLGVREKLALVAMVCDGVHHAHQKGVLHRDLKPSNILVGRDGKPKVLDFGIGRWLDAEKRAGAPERTRTGSLLGTLGYMSPEQADGLTERIDVRADVYALGVVLYELLSGELPLKWKGLALTDALRRLRDVDPVRLGTFDIALRGDVEIVVAKALAKEPERRYASAEALAEDLRRLLRDEPILARPSTWSYRARKFVARNKGASFGMAVALLAVVAGAVLSILWALRAERSAELARRAERRASIEARENAQVVDFVQRLFAAAMPQVADGEELTARQVVETGRDELPASFAPDSWSGARLQAFFGGVLIALGDYEEARRPIDAALPILEATDGAEHPRVLEALADRAQILSRHKEEGPARELYEEILRRAEASRQPRLNAVVRSHLGLGYMARAREAFEDAEQHFETAHRLLEAMDGSEIRKAQALAEVASVQTLTARLDESLATLQLARETAGDDAPRLFLSKLETTFGILHSRRGEGEEAAAAFERALDSARAVLEEGHPGLVQLQLNLAGVLGPAGRLEEAEALLGRAVEIGESSSGVPPESFAQALQNLGNCFAMRSDVEGAMERWERALAIWVELAGPESEAAASLYQTMSWGHAQRGEMEKAEELEARARRIRGESQGR